MIPGIQFFDTRLRVAFQSIVSRFSSVEARITDLEGTEWIDVAFETGWENYSVDFPSTNFGDCQYRKVGDVVELRGLARSNAANPSPDVIFILPEGYRPPKQTIGNTYTQSGWPRLDITIDGECLIDNVTADNQFASIDHFSFSIT